MACNRTVAQAAHELRFQHMALFEHKVPRRISRNIRKDKVVRARQGFWTSVTVGFLALVLANLPALSEFYSVIKTVKTRSVYVKAVVHEDNDIYPVHDPTTGMEFITVNDGFRLKHTSGIILPYTMFTNAATFHGVSDLFEGDVTHILEAKCGEKLDSPLWWHLLGAQEFGQTHEYCWRNRATLFCDQRANCSDITWDDRIVVDDYGFELFSRFNAYGDIITDDYWPDETGGESITTQYYRHDIMLSHEGYDLDSGSNGLGKDFNQFLLSFSQLVRLDLVSGEDGDINWNGKCSKPDDEELWCTSRKILAKEFQRRKPLLPDAVFLFLALVSVLAAVFFPEREDAGEVAFQVYKETREIPSWQNYSTVPDTGEVMGLSVNQKTGEGHIGTVGSDFTRVKNFDNTVTKII